MLKAITILIAVVSLTCMRGFGQANPDSTFSAFFVNAFTPNGDELNETFKPECNFIKSYQLVIYSRTNNMTFKGEENQPWDGFYQGVLVPQGLYIYYAYVIDGNGTEHVYKGNLLVLY